MRTGSKCLFVPCCCCRRSMSPLLQLCASLIIHSFGWIWVITCLTHVPGVSGARRNAEVGSTTRDLSWNTVRCQQRVKMESSALINEKNKGKRCTCYIWLVVEPPLWKNISQLGQYIPNIWKNKKCSKPPTRYSFQGIWIGFGLVLERNLQPAWVGSTVAIHNLLL